jgi:hypothetical protein
VSEEQTNHPEQGDRSYEAISKDLQVLSGFFTDYCRLKHGKREKHRLEAKGRLRRFAEVEWPEVCAECDRLFRYSAMMRVNCPLDPKPACRHCPTICYRDEEYRAMERVMSTVGMRRGIRKLLNRILGRK